MRVIPGHVVIAGRRGEAIGGAVGAFEIKISKSSAFAGGVGGE